MSKESKLFVGGYYDSRIFKGEEFDGKTPFNKDIDTYTMSEVLKLGFVDSGFRDWLEDNDIEEWNEITEEEKVKAILTYTENDDIAGLCYFETEEEAENFKNEVIKEIEEIEQNVIYVGQEQDSYGYYREVYEYKNNEKVISVYHGDDCEWIDYTIEELNQHFNFVSKPNWDNVREIFLRNENLNVWMEIILKNGQNKIYNKVHGTYVLQ